MVANEKLYGRKEASVDVPSVTEEITAGIEAAQFDCGVDCGLEVHNRIKINTVYRMNFTGYSIV